MVIDDPTSGEPAVPAMSIIIPVHNGASTLGAQLDAVRESAGVDMEILVVDNQSTDGSAAVVMAASELDPRVRLVSAADRPGEAYARNVGARNARSDALAYCDADDVVSPTWASSMLAALEGLTYATGPVDVDLLNPPWLAGVRGRRIFAELPVGLAGIPFAHGCNIGVRRQAMDLVGGFDESVVIGTDIDFAIRLHARGVVLGWAPGAIVHYRHREDTRARWRQAMAYGRAGARLRRSAGLDWPLRARAAAQARRALWLVRTAPAAAFRREVRTRWLWTLALGLGELRGVDE